MTANQSREYNQTQTMEQFDSNCCFQEGLEDDQLIVYRSSCFSHMYLNLVHQKERDVPLQMFHMPFHRVSKLAAWLRESANFATTCSSSVSTIDLNKHSQQDLSVIINLVLNEDHL